MSSQKGAKFEQVNGQNIYKTTTIQNNNGHENSIKKSENNVSDSRIGIGSSSHFCSRD